MPFEVTKLGEQPSGRFEVTKFGEGTAPMQQAQPEEPEGWGGYLGRNLGAKLPTYGYEAVRTGLGAGNIAQPLARAMLPNRGIVQFNAEELRKNPLFRNTQPNEQVDLTRLLPFVGGGTARQETASVLPKVMTEQRPEDWWPEFLMSKAIPLALNFPKSLPDVLQTLAMYGGGNLASNIMGSVAPSITKNEDLQEFLEQAAGLAGGHYTGKGVRALMEGATGRLAPRVEAHENELLNKEIAIAEEQYQAQKTAYEQKEQQRVEQEKGATAKIYAPALEEARAQEAKIISQLPKEKDAFEQGKRDRIIAVNKEKYAFEQEKKNRVLETQKEIAAYEDNIKSLSQRQNEAYKASELVRNGDLTGDAEPVMDAANRAARISGLSASDEAAVRKATEQVEGAITDDTMTLEKAIELQKNFNGQLYPKPAARNEAPTEVSKNFKRAMAPIIDALGKFIETTGGQEHFKPWSEGEELTRTISDLSKNKKKFVKSKTDIIKSINAEKFPASDMIKSINAEKFPLERQNALESQALQVKHQRSQLEKEYNIAMKQIGPVTWEKLMRDERSQQKLEQNFIDAATESFEKTERPAGTLDTSIKVGLGAVGAVLGYLKLGLLGSGLGTLGGFIGKTAYNQIGYARKVFKKYPSVKNETYKLIKDATRLTPERLALRMSSLGHKVEAIYDKIEDQED
jgi:hypothetical protein